MTSSTLMLDFLEQGLGFRVTRSDLEELAKKLDVSPVDVIHLALRRLLQEIGPGYAPDDGPLSDEELATLRARADAAVSRSTVVSRSALF